MTSSQKNVHFSDENRIIIIDLFDLSDTSIRGSVSTSSSIEIVPGSEQFIPINKKKSFVKVFEKIIGKIKKLFNKN
jgi:hypothetical protein